MDSGSISIPVNQRWYEKKLRDLKSHPGVAGVYEPDQNSHGETDLIATPAANGMWNRTIWALLRVPGGGAFGSGILFGGILVLSSAGAACGDRRVGGIHKQVCRGPFRLWLITSASHCLQGHCDTAFSQFAALALNRCQTEQEKTIQQTGLRCWNP